MFSMFGFRVHGWELFNNMVLRGNSAGDGIDDADADKEKAG